MTFDVRVSVGLAAGNAWRTFSDYIFMMSIRIDHRQPAAFFFFRAWDDPHQEITDESSPRGARVAVNRFWNGPGDGFEESFDTVPGSFETSIVVPFSSYLGNTLDLEIYNWASAEAANSAMASVSSLNSGWLGIAGDYTSASGFTYTGYTAAVPEPGTALLWLLGSGLLAFAAGRSTRR